MDKNNLITFAKHLEDLFKGEGTVKELPSNNPELGPVYAFVFHDHPDQGMMTVVTYGLSEANHEKWHFGRPELMLTVDSNDESWADSLMHVVNEFRGKKSFSPGSVYELDQVLSDDSIMRGFVVLSPSFLNQDECAIQLEDKLVYLTQAYPIYSGEAEVIRTKGVEAFWNDQRLKDVYDVRREDVSK